MISERKALGILIPLLGVLLGVNYELGTFDTEDTTSVSVPIEVIADPVRRGSCGSLLDCA